MRVLTTLTLCGLVMLVGGWARGTAPKPPRCSSFDSQHWTTEAANMDSPPWSVSVPRPGKPNSNPLYVRFCGPAQASVRVHGASYRIAGGHCSRMEGEFLVRIGMIGNAPVKPAEFVGLFLHHPKASRAGTFKLAETAAGTVYAAIHHRSRDLAVSGGTITIGRSRRAGTFALRLHDASRVTGSWSCS